MLRSIFCKALPAVVLVGFSLAATAQPAARTFEHTLPATSELELDVMTGAGTILVRGTDAELISIRGEISLAPGAGLDKAAAAALIDEISAAPPVELDGLQLRVGYLDASRVGNVVLSFEIEVPPQTRVVTASGSGSQRIVGISQPVRATSGSGGLEFEGIDGAVNASAGSGSIRAEGIAGPFAASSGSGSIRLVQTAPGVVDISTGSGSVEISLLPSSAFDVDVRTGSGRINIDRPVTLAGAIERNKVEGKVQGGGPLLRVRTGSGSVHVD